MHIKQPMRRRSSRLHDIFAEISQKVLHIQIFVISLRCTNTIEHHNSETSDMMPAY